MFTGIIRGIASVKSIKKLPGLDRLELSFPPGSLVGVERGASIALDGVCLTVTEFDAQHAAFDVMHETLRVTTLGLLSMGGRVNFERAAPEGAEVGGHVLSGHVDFTATISQIRTPENNHVVTFAVPSQWSRYIFSKGYIAINGASLTITNASRDTNTFDVWLIPETLRMTTFAEKAVGAPVNIEIERQTQVIVDTVTTFLRDNMAELIGRSRDLGSSHQS